MTLFLAVAGFTTASATAKWVGNSAINVNGTWYRAGNSGMSWCTGGAFDGANLGIFGNTLLLGGQSQIYDWDGNDWGSGSTMIMGYKIDGGADETTTLRYYKFENNNNFFQSGGSTFTTIDITGLSDGDHNIAVWFVQDGVYDSNNNNNYVATFTVDNNHPNIGTIQWNTTDGGFYEINAESDLHDLAVYVNGTGNYYTGAAETTHHYCSGMTFKQSCDITMTGEHTAIGTLNKYFCGTFDGNDKFITRLTINKPDDFYQGLFGYTSGATFKNVNIVNCSVKAKYCVSGLVGYLSGGTIEKCTVTGTIKGSSQFIGGIAGNAYYATIKNCFSDATVEGGYNAGSIMGTMNSTATDNYHSATTIGGVGTYYSNEDKPGAEIAAKISAGTGVTITYPENPSCVWNGENLYKSGTVVKLTYTVPTGNVFDHYSVSSGQISDPGTQGGEHTLTGFTQDVVISGSYADSQRDIADGAIANITALTFNGRAQQPKPVVTYGDERLVEYENYTVTYSEGCTNAGKYSVYVTGTGRYTGSLSKEYTISPLNISTDGAITILGIEANYGQTGSAVHPKPAAVTSSAANNATLVEGTDYSLSYNGDCILPGNYSITLTGQGNYTGEKAVPFTILDAFGITLHNGTATNSSVPVYGSFCDIYPRSEFLMPASELTAMSGKAVTSMQFYLCSKARKAWGGTFQVFMKEVEGTTLSGFSGTDGATIVYEGSLDGTGNVMTVNFDTPYAYNGGNLLVGFYRTTKGDFSEVSFYGETVSGASVFGSTNVFGPCSANQGNFLPKTTLWYEEMTTLADNATDNSTTIDNKNSQTTKVRLEGRTLYQDGDWNTICLPFDVTLANSPLAGATAKTLETASLDNGTLTLNFGNDVTTLEAGTPYIIKWSSDLVIKTESDWNSFASAVAGGNTYEGKVVRLDADISVSTSVGRQTKPTKPFKGVFDGCGHTLNVTLTGNSQGCAPFGVVEGATIVNLKTTGTVTLTSSSAYHASGLVGFSNGSTIKNCHVSVSVLFPSGTGTVHSGGIIGHALSAPFTMTDCLFDGTIGYVDGGTGTMTNVGGLVGWHDDSTPNITHCFNGGTFANPDDIARIARVGGNGTITDCYTNVNADCQGEHGDSRGDYTNATGSELQALLGDGWKVDDQGNVVPIFGKYTTTITNPSFANVTIDKTDRSITSGGVTFKGNYDAQTFNAENKSVLFLGAKNTLYYPLKDATIGACRAYFEILNPNPGTGGVRQFVLNFGDGEETQGISEATPLNDKGQMIIDGWYTLNGVKVEKPTRKGLYIQNGKKVVIK